MKIYIFKTLGASDAIKGILKLMICIVDDKKPGVMVPIPQYPLYSASLAEFDMYQISYYLNESKNWGLEISELQVIMTFIEGINFEFFYHNREH